MLPGNSPDTQPEARVSAKLLNFPDLDRLGAEIPLGISTHLVFEFVVNLCSSG